MKKGFTLIELLIVVSIIAILSGVTLSIINVGRIRSRAQDSVRREDLSTIAGAYERYYSDNNTYPSGNVSVRDAMLINGGYIKEVPKDPETNVAYTYGQYNGGQDFCICTLLKGETPASSERKNCPAALGGNYCVVNPF